MQTYHLAPSYVNTFIANNVKKGQIFSVAVKEQSGIKRTAGRIVSIGSNGKHFVIKPMNGKAGNVGESVFVHNLKMLKIKGVEYNILN